MTLRDLFEAVAYSDPGLSLIVIGSFALWLLSIIVLGEAIKWMLP